MRAIVIEYRNGKRAALSVDGWASDDAALARSLALMYPYPDPDYPRYDPDPLLRIATEAAKRTGAQVVDAPAVDLPSGSVA